MAYIINGPVTVGDAATATQINGNVSLTNVSSATGDILYTSNNTGLLAALSISAGGILIVDNVTSLPSWFAPGALGQILVSGGAGIKPAWLTQGTTGQVLTSAGAGANPTWATAPSSGTYAFSATYVNTTPQTTTKATYSTGNANLTSGSFTIVGGSSPPVWTRAMVGGQFVTGGITYQITGFVSATSISIFPAPGSTLTNQSYTITYSTPVILTNWSTSTSPFYDSTSGGFSAATGVFTNPNAIGKYNISASVSFTETSNSGYRILQVIVTPNAGSATVALQRAQESQSATSLPSSINISGLLKLATGDTVKIQLFSTSSGTTTAIANVAANVSSATWWNMALVSTS